ncbi:prolyl oligopeptidase family serine peptidase [Galbibacter sp. BG1]|uniref:prolyl oligopeptidase family serine peptidase n=1 Tax=Galbibacter sp. BG1 TaxID=1170699 RepID=UPI0015BF2EA8|nr:prolyl oligopeptidase family serine peptidase [Galbibacter sp. BG1]QLE02919.1 prolyl oligopeptidase family serine peptidase [Galbibacter sp. BG1]
MKKYSLWCFLFVSTILVAQDPVKPEKTPEKVVTDEYFGQKIDDPYRYLENLDDPNVISWMKDNANYAEAVLNKIPGKQKLNDEMLALINRKDANIYNVNITNNNHYFYLKQLPEDETGKLFYRNGYKGEEKFLFDPLSYKKDSGLTYTISSLSPNIDGTLVSVELAPNGSETGEMFVLNLKGEKVSQTIEPVWGIGPSWLEDGQHFLYTPMNSSDVTAPNRETNTKVRLHKLGTDPSIDADVFSAENNPELNIEPKEIPIVFYEPDSKLYIAVVVTVDKSYKIYAKRSLESKGTPWKPLAMKEDQVSDFFLTENAIYYQTFKNASNFKILKSSLENPAISMAKEIVPQPKTGVLVNFAVNKSGLYYVVNSNGVEAKVYFKPSGSTETKELKLPFTAGNASLYAWDSKEKDVFVNISGWTSPEKRYRYSPDSNSFIAEPLSSEVKYPELEDLTVKEVMIPSHDGVKVPVSIIYNKKIKMSGKNPAVIYGYGAYGISMNPFFSPVILAYTLHGGIMVVPHVRGGGELGDEWHMAGQKLTKPNTWKDAIATAEYLIKEKYTSKEKLSIWSASAGGIFVGRAITERPDLFVAACPEVGCMNTIRGEDSPNGPVNIPEFGTVKDPDEFKGLLEMDSYHHLEKGTKYPATLITAGINDPRVIAWQPAKFAAKMQADNASDKPILFLTDFEGGHGMGDTKSQAIESLSGILSFFYWQSGHPEFQPEKAITDN